MAANIEKVSPIQVILLLSVSRISIVMLWFNFENQDVWITEILSLFYIVVLCGPLLYLGNRFSYLTPIEYLQVLTGRAVGKILGFLYICFFVRIIVMDLSLFDNVLRPINLPETPDYAILFLAILTCTYSVYKGLECIVRVAEIFTPLILLAIVFYELLLIPEMDFKVFLPILADSSLSKINWLAFMNATRLHEIILLAMLIPVINDRGKKKMVFWWMVIIVTIFSLIIICTTLAGLGLDVPKKTFDPYYLFVKQINIYDFITRIEFFLVGAWNIGMFLKISIVFYLTTIAIVQVFEFKNRKVFITPMAIIIYGIMLKSDVLKSVVVFNAIQNQTPYINLIFIFVIPVIAVAIFFLKRVIKGEETANN